MARSGITQKMVKQAMAQLTAKSTAITVDAVRAQLGHTGSKTTICRFMNELDAQTAEKADLLSLLDNSLSLMIADMAKKLHDDAQAPLLAAQAENEAMSKQWQAKYNVIKDTLEETQQTNASLRVENGSLNNTIKDLELSLSQNQVLSASQAKDIGSLKEHITLQEGHIASLEDKHIQSRDALNHFREAAKSQRDQETQRHANEVQLLQSELRQARQEIVVKQEALSTQSQMIATLQNDIKHLTAAFNSAETELTDLTDTQSELSKQISSLTMALNDAQAQKKTALEKQAVAEAKVQSLNKQNEQYASEAIRLAASLANQEKLISTWMTKQHKHSKSESNNQSDNPR